MVEALETERLGERLIPVGEPFGKDIVASERALAFLLLSSMAESAHKALSSGRTRNRYASIAALVLEALRPGIPLYEAAVEDHDNEMSKASSTLIEALAGGPTEAIDSQYLQRLRAKLGMPLPPSTA